MAANIDHTQALIAQTQSQPSVMLALSDIEQSRDFQKRAAEVETKAQWRAIGDKEKEVVRKLIADLEASPDHHPSIEMKARVWQLAYSRATRI